MHLYVYSTDLPHSTDVTIIAPTSAATTAPPRSIKPPVDHYLASVRITWISGNHSLITQCCEPCNRSKTVRSGGLCSCFQQRLKRWSNGSVVLTSASAKQYLCYWRPVYRALRRVGHYVGIHPRVAPYVMLGQPQISIFSIFNNQLQHRSRQKRSHWRRNGSTG
jgi:hypothetical protein